MPTGTCCEARWGTWCTPFGFACGPRSAARCADGNAARGAFVTESLIMEEEARGPFWATDLPLLHLHMLLPRKASQPRVFPFSHPRVQYVHFARNAIYALAGHFGL